MHEPDNYTLSNITYGHRTSVQINGIGESSGIYHSADPNSHVFSYDLKAYFNNNNKSFDELFNQTHSLSIKSYFLPFPPRVLDRVRVRATISVEVIQTFI